LPNFEQRKATILMVAMSNKKKEIMKKLILALVATILSFAGMAQAAKATGTPETMKTSVKEGVFTFNLPDNVTAEEIERTQKYYVDYFTVDFDASSKLLTVKMVDNSPESRRVVTRLLVSNGISEIEFNGNNYRVTEFYDLFMRD
jgi:hypothetical protein